MNLLDIERTVRRISEVLPQGIVTETAPRLASDYASACHSANHRLQQCESMIKAGDRPQAMQLAETSPNLLEMVTILEFQGADEWRAWCQQSSLTVPDRIDGRAVQVLNECYEHGITTDHPLYAMYRRAVLERDDEQAVEALRRITQHNVSDTNALSELERLDRKVLDARLRRLMETLQQADRARVVEEVEEIEGFGFRAQPAGGVWREAQTIRCQVLLEEAEDLKTSARWAEALGRIDLIRRLQGELGIGLSADDGRRLEEVQGWAQREQAKAGKDREFRGLLAELGRCIQLSEEKDTASRYVEMPELREDFAQLHRIWRALGEFGRSMPEGPTTAFRKRAALLEGEIGRRESVRRRNVLLVVAVVFLITAAGAGFVLGQIRARNLAKDLRAAAEGRRARDAERLVAEGKASRSFWSRNQDLTEAVAQGAAFLAKEGSLHDIFREALAKLPETLEPPPEPRRLTDWAGKWKAAREAWMALATDLKAEHEPRIQAFEKRWEDFLAASAPRVNELFEQSVVAAEREGARLSFQDSAEDVREGLVGLRDAVRKLQDGEAGFTNHLKLNGEVLQRSAAVQAKFLAYDDQIKRLDEGMASLRKAATVKEYTDAIERLAASEFSMSGEVIAARAARSLRLEPDAWLRGLLEVTNSSTWAYVRGAAGDVVRFVPASVMPTERQLLTQLVGDPAVGLPHQRCKLWLDAEGKDYQEWVVAGWFAKTEGWKKISAWNVSSTPNLARFEDQDYGIFAGEPKLSPKVPVFRIEPLAIADPTACFPSLGVDRVLEGTETYKRPLLEVLDATKDDRRGSALFRAYVMLRLLEIMRLQPDAWGLTFCPSLLEHEARIKGIAGGDVVKGDWFLSRKAAEVEGRMEAFWASVGPVSYTRQARGLLSLARAAAEPGLAYVGYVGVDGKLSTREGKAGRDLWGYATAQKGWVLLAAGEDPPGATRAPARPLSPVFSLPHPREEYLEKAGVQPGEPSFRDFLPPLFRGPGGPRS